MAKMIAQKTLLKMRHDLETWLNSDIGIDVRFRRGTGLLPPQRVILQKQNSQTPKIHQDNSGKQTVVDVSLRGKVDLDARIGDKFNINGTLYKIIFVYADRTLSTIVEAQVIE